MGNGIFSSSQKLICPKDYDKNNFNLILSLYDKLDNNGDRVVEANELKDIANLHIKNKQTEISNLRKKEQIDYKFKMEEAQKLYEIKLQQLAFDLQKNLENINNANIIKDVSLQTDYDKLEKMDEKQRCETFLKIISDDDDNIQFWKFFDYMKNRTHDIKNIEITS